jgi:hypothetical protein
VIHALPISSDSFAKYRIELFLVGVVGAVIPGTKWPERAAYYLPQSDACCRRPTVELQGAVNNRFLF